MTREQRDSLIGLLPPGAVLFDEPMARHSSLGAGGSAEAYVRVEDTAELIRLLGWALENVVDYRFFGFGSATLVRDGGVSGLMVKLGSGFKAADLERQQGDDVFVSAGAAFRSKDLANLCAARGLAGAEPFGEFDGTVAGALFAKGGETTPAFAPAIEEVTIVTKEGRELTLRGQALRFEEGALKIPRTSAVVKILFKLKAAADARSHDETSADDPGSQMRLARIFASPCKTKASVLIEEAGLCGVRVGGARVSNRDANSIVNEGQATARDVAVLMSLVRDRVKDETGITLTPLIDVIGER